LEVEVVVRQTHLISFVLLPQLVKKDIQMFDE
jgi:hypothetical protein